MTKLFSTATMLGAEVETKDVLTFGGVRASTDGRLMLQVQQTEHF
jgi:hypothetical protein